MSDAIAQTAVPNTQAPAATPMLGAGSPFGSILPLLLIFAVFYFLLIRPQQKKVRDHAAMVKNLRRGDKVVTGGGIIGTIVKVDGDGVVQVEIAPDVKVKVASDSIMAVAAKTGDAEGEPAKTKKETKLANDN